MAGTYLHLHLALGAFPAAFGTPVQAMPPELAAFLAGAIAPDLGYFPGGPAAFSQAVHHRVSGDLTRALVQSARSSEEEAFAAGWALHIETDVTTHPLINDRIATDVARSGRRPAPASRADLWHKRIEWGLDCRILQATHYEPPLWLQPLRVPLQDHGPPEGDLLARAAAPILGAAVDAPHLRRAAVGLAGWIRRLAEMLRWSGAAGGAPRRRWLPAAARSLARRGVGVRAAEDAVAMLTPEPPDEAFTLQVLGAADRAVAAFQRGWLERFRHMPNRDLDTGRRLPA